MNPTFNRRQLLKLFGTAGFAAPLLNVLSPQAAFAAGTIKRIIFVFHPNGCVLDKWHTANTNGSIGDLSESLSPLAAYKDQLILFRNLHMLDGNGDGHPDPFNQLLTGAYDANGGSVDVHIASKLGQNLIHLGVRSGSTFQSGGAITRYVGGNEKQPEDNPVVAYNNYLGNVPTGGTTPSNPDAALDGKILERAIADLDALIAASPTSQKNRLAVHRASLDSELKKLDTTVISTTSCSKYDANLYGVGQNDFTNMDAVPNLISMQMRTMVHAMACGASRVGTLQLSTHTGLMKMGFTGIELEQGKWAMEDHAASHNNSIVHASIKKWYNSKIAELAGMLKSVAEPTGAGGTMLDHTIIFVGTEVAQGAAHTRQDMPFYLLGGKASGALTQTGVVFNANGQSHAKLLSSLSTAIGAGSFGSAGNLPGLLAG